MKKQYIMIDEDGNYFYYSDKEMTIPHRENGPAVEYADGDRVWYLDGKLHRENGPAVEFGDENRVWCIHGQCHRLDGPVVEFDVGIEWWIKGKTYTEEEFIKAVKME